MAKHGFFIYQGTGATLTRFFILQLLHLVCIRITIHSTYSRVIYIIPIRCFKDKKNTIVNFTFFMKEGKSLSAILMEINPALTDRTNEVEEQLLMPDPQYQKLNTKINEVLDRIGQNLPPDKERLLFELDEFWVERDVLAYRRMYRQGLQDGIVVNRVMRMVRKREK